MLDLHFLDGFRFQDDLPIFHGFGLFRGLRTYLAKDWEAPRLVGIRRGATEKDRQEESE